jgi:hypothetical protein
MRTFLLITILAIVPVSLMGQTAAPKAKASVTYTTSTTIYIDAGTNQGLDVGSEVFIVRADSIIATLRVSAASSRRSSCDVSGLNVDFVVGDVVTFEPSFKPAEQPSLYPTLSSSHAESRAIKGRLSLRHIAMLDYTGFDHGYWEPGLDVRLEGRWQQRWRLNVDARARRTFRANSDAGRTRVYSLLGEWRSPQKGLRLALGRQFAAGFSSVSVFDGIVGEWSGNNFATGMFAGWQPDRVSWGLSNDVSEYGAYVEFKGMHGDRSRWSVTTAGIGSYTQDTINREYIAIQARWIGPRLVGYAIQEVDVNRDWKKVAENSSLSPTSFMVSGRVVVSSKWSVDGGFDNRRRVRLYYDFISPEIEFDDSNRQGVWLGGQWRATQTMRISARAKQSTGGMSGDVNMLTGRLSSPIPWVQRSTFSVRSTIYENERSDGYLASGSVSYQAAPILELGLSFGVRKESSKVSGVDDNLNWFSVDIDVPLSPRWYANTSIESTNGDFEDSTQIYSSLTWRF